ncbi:39S ribosomal protein L52, mitochondrial isoform X2 [Mauremys reevesii]|uniref:39S ribosomal protein L52, mitochondrial isoform X2 n=1 Tax=Mauremys reevesii TaxID=260615 RepID=UPI0019401E30|nr:39S ribosomal protein L52, mitochondrial isoform X2 [Mauremys reevesii]
MVRRPLLSVQRGSFRSTCIRYGGAYLSSNQHGGSHSKNGGARLQYGRCVVSHSEHGAAYWALPFPTWRRLYPPCRTEFVNCSHMVPTLLPVPFPNMAAPLGLRLAPRLAAAPRHIHCGAPRPAVGQWRVQQGLAASSAGYGPLRDLPDWSFVDGRPAPPWKGQMRRQQEDEAFAASQGRVCVTRREILEGRTENPPAYPVLPEVGFVCF